MRKFLYVFRWSFTVLLLMHAIYCVATSVINGWIVYTGYLPESLIDASEWYKTDYLFWALVCVPFQLFVAWISFLFAALIMPKRPSQKNESLG